MIFICFYCPKTKAGRHDNSAHVERFVCLECKRKGRKPPPLPGEKTFVVQSRTTVEVRSLIVMRPKRRT